MLRMIIALLGILSIPAFSQQTQGPLTNERIGGLVLAGVSESEIIRIISSAPAISFDLRPNSTDELLKVGVSEDVIKAMAARESGTPVSSASPVTASIRRTRNDPAAPVAPPKAPVVTTPVPYRVPAESSFDALHGGGAHKLSYDGGSIPNLKTGSSVKLYVDQNEIHILRDGVSGLTLPALAVTEISYGQTFIVGLAPRSDWRLSRSASAH